MLARMGETSLTKDNPNTDFPHDVRFDPYRSPRTDRLKTQVEEITQQVEVYEEYFQMRKRKRKPVDEQIFKETICAIVCDLMYNYLSNPEQKVFLTLSHRHLGTNSRYRSRVLSKTIPDILKILSSPEIGFICMSKGGKAEHLKWCLLNPKNWSGWRDSNSRPSAPKADALPACATPRQSYTSVTINVFV